VRGPEGPLSFFVVCDTQPMVGFMLAYGHCAWPEERAVTPRARGLLEWNGMLPNVRVVEEEKHGVTQTFMVVADYGWAERILCGGCYLPDAEAICAAIEEVLR